MDYEQEQGSSSGTQTVAQPKNVERQAKRKDYERKKDEPAVQAMFQVSGLRNPFIDDTSAVLLWDAVKGDDVTYIINLLHNGQIRRTMETSETDISIYDLEPNTEYEISLRAKNGRGDESKEVLKRIKTDLKGKFRRLEALKAQQPKKKMEQEAGEAKVSEDDAMQPTTSHSADGATNLPETSNQSD